MVESQTPSQKTRLRTEIRARRATVSAGDPARGQVEQQVRRALTRTCSHKFPSWPEVAPPDPTAGRRPAGQVGILGYASIGDEPSIDAALDRAREAGANVFLPIVVNVGQPLMFGQLTGSIRDLPRQGKWQIRQPEPACGPAELLAHIDIALIPGLSFSAAGFRLGNGGGFYDRTFGPQGAAPLAGQGVRTYGVCFDTEFGHSFPTRPWDLTVDAVITDAGITATSARAADLTDAGITATEGPHK